MQLTDLLLCVFVCVCVCVCVRVLCVTVCVRVRVCMCDTVTWLSICTFYSGGIESMSITEVFGGKLTAPVLFDILVLSQVLSLLPVYNHIQDLFVSLP